MKKQNELVTILSGLLVASAVVMMVLSGGCITKDGSDPSISVEVPSDCHATVAIDDATGRRIRNLVSDIELKKGTQQLQWDGRDDDGRLVPPGEYKWVGLTRGKLDVLYRGTWQEGAPPWPYGKTGGWLSDHYPPCAVTVVGDRILIGAGVSEYGRGISCVDMEGKVIWADRWLAGIPWNGAASLKTDGERVFAMGFPNWVSDFHTVVEIDPATGKMWPVVRIATPPKDSALPQPLLPGSVVKDDERTKNVKGLRLVGVRRTGGTRWEGELYVTDILGDQPRTFVYSTARSPEANDVTGYYGGWNNRHYTMSLLRVLPLKIWDMAWLPDGRCVVALDKSVAVLDTRSGSTTPLIATGLEAPFSVTTDSKGRIYVSDRGGRAQKPPTSVSKVPHLGMRLSDKSSQQVKIFDSKGAFLRAIGREGGRRLGPIDPKDFDMPAGLVSDVKGRLWVTEESYPKRVSVWTIPGDVSATAPVLAKEFFSSSEYGEAGVMPDPKNPRQIISATKGVLWDVDLTQRSFRPLQLLPRVYGPECFGYMTYDPALPFSLTSWASIVDAFAGAESFRNGVTVKGRRFIYSASGGVTVIGDWSVNEFKALAAFGMIDAYVSSSGQYGAHWVPDALLEAAKKNPKWNELAKREGLDPAMTDLPHDPKRIKWPQALNAFNWTDSNGDGRMQAAEIKLGKLSAGHGVRVVALESNLDAIVSVLGNLWRMKCKGINEGGAPLYDWSEAIPMLNGTVGTPSYVGAANDLLILPAEVSRSSDIRYIDSAGRLKWSYPTVAPGHNHRTVPDIKTKIMAPGSIYGVWNMQGVASLPEGDGHVFLVHGGHGMDYLMTLEDGLFIGTVFKPQCAFPSWDEIPEAKPGMSLNDYSPNDECFGGSFVRVERSDAGFEAGHYYRLGMHRSAVVELTGLDSVKRLPGGSVTFTKAAFNEAKAGDLADAAERWQVKVAGRSFDIQMNDGGFNPNIRSAVNLGYGGSNGRVFLWHNPKGLGIGVTFDRIAGTPVSDVFTNAAPSWEQVILYGDSIEVDVVAELPSGAPAADARRLVFANWQGTPMAVQYRRVKVEDVPVGAKMLQVKSEKNGLLWIAERLDAPLEGFKLNEPNGWNINANFYCVIPLEKLGLSNAKDLEFRANIVLNTRLPADGGVRRTPWMKDGTDSIMDLASALDRSPELWRPCLLRPKAYVFPPPIPGGEDGTAKKGEFVLCPEGDPQGKPVDFAGSTVWLTATKDSLKLKWYVEKDASPFINNGKDWTLLFKTGDACDLQLESPKLGRCRYLVTMSDGKPAVIRYRYGATNAAPDQGVWYQSPVGKLFVPVVETLAVEPLVYRADTWYTVELAIPWATLGIDPKRGGKVNFELGVLRSDATGTKTTSRDYWNSGLSGMTQDVPTEAKPTENWGTLKFK